MNQQQLQSKTILAHHSLSHSANHSVSNALALHHSPHNTRPHAQHDIQYNGSDNSKNQQLFSHLIKTDDELGATFELIQILRQFQHADRWTLLIAPENIPDKALLNCCSVDMDRVLVVHEKQITNILATIENALSHATCSAVIAWSNGISQQRLVQINGLAEQSRCHFYAFNKHH